MSMAASEAGHNGDQASKDNATLPPGTWHLYLVAFLVAVLFVSTVYTLRYLLRLLLVINMHRREKRGMRPVDEDDARCNWLIRAVGRPSEAPREAKLPSYESAVKSGFLRRAMSSGMAGRRHSNIADEEVELERINRLGGAPPGEICAGEECYASDGAC